MQRAMMMKESRRPKRRRQHVESTQVSLQLTAHPPGHAAQTRATRCAAVTCVVGSMLACALRNTLTEQRGECKGLNANDRIPLQYCTPTWSHSVDTSEVRCCWHAWSAARLLERANGPISMQHCIPTWLHSADTMSSAAGVRGPQRSRWTVWKEQMVRFLCSSAFPPGCAARTRVRSSAAGVRGQQRAHWTV